jgi:hypothetical protein
MASHSLIRGHLCYPDYALWKERVQASQAKTPYGIRGLARDCDTPLSTAYLPSKELEAALVALAGRPVTGQVSPCSSSASITDSNADIRIHGAVWYPCIYSSISPTL